jgi:hypothetical protein
MRMYYFHPDWTFHSVWNSSIQMHKRLKISITGIKYVADLEDFLWPSVTALCVVNNM